MNARVDDIKRATAIPGAAEVERPIRLASGFGAMAFEPVTPPSGQIEHLHFDLADLNLHRRARANADTILSVVEALGQAQQRGQPVTPAANWLLDNHYLVEDTVVEVRRDLPGPRTSVENLILAGDATTHPSIEGAVSSGVRAAEIVDALTP